jgi:DNA-3-methyladenine glycosylase
VKQWDQQQFDEHSFYIDDVNIKPVKVIQATRLGIPAGRDEDLPYRFIDYDFARYCTSNPLTRRSMVENKHYKQLQPR